MGQKIISVSVDEFAHEKCKKRYGYGSISEICSKALRKAVNDITDAPGERICSQCEASGANVEMFWDGFGAWICSKCVEKEIEIQKINLIARR